MDNSSQVSAGDADDILCDKCGEPYIKSYYGSDGVPCGEPVDCKCIREQKNHDKEEQRQRQLQHDVALYRRTAFDESQDAECTFDIDDNRNDEASQTAKKYTRNYDKMKQENCGIILIGPNGTGKTFLSRCLANAVIDRGVIARVTKLQTLIDKITANNYRDKYEVLHDIGWYDFLVIDEFKADASTSKVIEMIVDARYESHKPLVISTNIKPSELVNPPEGFRHTFDRIREMCCIHIVLNGDSRRPDIAAQKREMFDSLE